MQSVLVRGCWNNSIHADIIEVCNNLAAPIRFSLFTKAKRPFLLILADRFTLESIAKH
jgi:hypothetical protein